MDDSEILEIMTKFYTRKVNGWFVTGYKCPYCDKHYHTFRKEMYAHVRRCHDLRQEELANARS